MASVTLQDESKSRIKNEIKAKGLTQTKIAKDMGMERESLSRLINGGAPIHYDYVDYLADLFGVRSEYLLNLDNYRTDEEYERAVSGFNTKEIKAFYEKREKTYKSARQFLKYLDIRISDVLTVWFNMKEMDNLGYHCDFYTEYVSPENEEWKRYKEAVAKYYQLDPEERKSISSINGFSTGEDYYFRIKEIPKKFLDDGLESSHWFAPIDSKEDASVAAQKRFPVIDNWFFPYNIKKMYMVRNGDKVRFMTGDSLIEMLEMISSNIIGMTDSYLELKAVRHESAALTPRSSDKRKRGE